MQGQKIDIVYLWVDGEDSLWKQKRKNSYESISDILSLEKYANVEGRFRDNNEILYSLRSLEKYFPNHGNIFIITDNQIPDFLKENPKIHFIFHKDFIPDELLPTFSSKKLEAFIPNIPEISEVFLYLNDDVFLGPKFSIDDFYSGSSPFYIAPKSDSSVNVSYSDRILSEKYPDYRTPFQSSSHSPKLIIKSDFFEMKNEFPEIFRMCSEETFRTIGVPSFLGDMFPRWMIYKNKAKLKYLSYFYGESSSLQFDKFKEYFYNYSFFCINDTGDDRPKNHKSLLGIAEILQEIFPEKSSFEK